MCGLTEPRNKRKSLYLHYQSAYDDQNWEDDNLVWLTPAHKVRWLFDHVV